MDKIIIDLIGQPKITMDGKEVRIPLKKAEGLLYMLLLEGQMERVKLCTYFWPESNLETGRRNLRNAIYTLRRMLKSNIFNVADRSTVELNRELFILDGIDNIVESVKFNCLQLLNKDSLVLMDNFQISNLTEFGDWVENQRSKYISRFEKLLYSTVDDRNLNLDTKIKACKMLIEQCSFNEKYYRDLIGLYKEKGDWERCISIYVELDKILNDEFSLAPSKEVYEMVEECRANSGDRIRGYDLLLMKRAFEDFKGSGFSKALMVSGEPGIGKTALVDSFKSSIGDDFNILDMKCHKGKENSSYESFRPVIGQVMEIITSEGLNIPDYMSLVLSTLSSGFGVIDNGQVAEKIRNGNAIEQVLISLFTILGTRKELIIVVDDLNFIDSMSFRIINKIISRLKTRVFTILICDRKLGSSQDRVLEYLMARDLLHEIKLERLNRNETFKLIRANIDTDNETMDFIYEESNGIPLFIMEYVRNIKEDRNFDIRNSAMSEIVYKKMNGLDGELKEFVEICALFHDDINLNDMAGIADIDEIGMIDIVESLIEKNMLKEEKSQDGEIELVFYHNQIKAFLRKEMTSAKRNLWNGRFAQYYESRIKGSDNDIELYSRLSYHFNQCNCRVKGFKYRILRFSSIVMMNYELFPDLDRINLARHRDIYSRGGSHFLEEMKELRKEYKILTDTGSLAGARDVEMIYQYAMGRYHIYIGNYETGREIIEDMIELAEETGSSEYFIKGSLKLMHYSMAKFDMNLLGRVLKKSEEMIDETKDPVLIAKMNRFKGYHLVQTGRFCEGEKHLAEGMKILKNLHYNRKYVLNIAASYVYLGESCYLRKDYKRAMDCCNKALDLCREEDILSEIAYILACKGRIFYAMRETEKAEIIFNEAISNYDRGENAWGVYLPYYYLSIIYRDRGEEKMARSYADRVLEYMKGYSYEFKNTIIAEIENEIRVKPNRLCG